jgi:hypothetical protein
VNPAIPSTRLGERTCVVTAPRRLDVAAGHRLEAGVGEALDDGCRDFVLDFTASRACCDSRPEDALVRVARRLDVQGCEVVVAARSAELLRFFASVPTWSALPVALERDEALALLLEQPVDASVPRRVQ